MISKPWCVKTNYRQATLRLRNYELVSCATPFRLCAKSTVSSSGVTKAAAARDSE